MKIPCVFCLVNDGENREAVALAPQNDLLTLALEDGGKVETTFIMDSKDNKYRLFAWRPVCEYHIQGWWDGSDVPEMERPRIVLVSEL